MVSIPMKTLTIGGVTHEIVDAAARADIQTLLDGIATNNIISLIVPVLADGASDYNDCDKSAVSDAIAKIAQVSNPVVILEYGNLRMPANYFAEGTHHYFTAIATDLMIETDDDPYVLCVDYDAVSGTLVVQNDLTLGGADIDVDTTLAVSGMAADAKTTGDRLTDLEGQLADLIADLNYTAISITSFTNNIGTVEIGSTITDVALAWKTNKPPTALILNGTSIDASSTSTSLSGLSITSDKTWSLTATDERNATTTKTTKITFLNGVYYGVIDSGTTINSDTLIGLTKKLQSSKSITFSATANAGQQILFALPASGYGTPAFKDKDTGFEAGFYKTKTFQFTNSSGHVESYDVWLSTNSGLGAMNIAVS